MPATIDPHPATAPDPEEDIAAHRAENPSPEPAGLPAETDTNPDPPVRDTRPEAPPPAADAGAAATTTVDEDGGLPRAPDVPQTRPNRTEQPTPPLPDVLTIVRDHVIPALVERRVIDRRDRPVVVQADRRDPSPSATAPVVSVDGVRTRAGDQPGPVPDGQLSPQHGTTPVAAPSVSVSIDRVVVTQAPPKQPPPQPVRPSPRPSVDHEAYLARRRAPR